MNFDLFFASAQPATGPFGTFFKIFPKIRTNIFKKRSREMPLFGRNNGVGKL